MIFRIEFEFVSRQVKYKGDTKKIVIFEGFPESEELRRKGNYLQKKGEEGGKGSLLNRGNQKMLHDRNSCLIVVSGCSQPHFTLSLPSLAIIAPKNS